MLRIMIRKLEFLSLIDPDRVICVGSHSKKTRKIFFTIQPQFIQTKKKTKKNFL